MTDLDPRLLEVALDVTRHLSRDECLERLAGGALELLGGDWGLAYVSSADGEDLVCAAVAGDQESAAVRETLGVLDAGLIRHLAPEGSRLMKQGADLVPEDKEPGLPAFGQALLIPLDCATGRFGLLLLLQPEGGEFPYGSREMADLLAKEVGPALENLRAVESLRELVIRDDTADCFNRRHLEQVLADEVERVRRFGGRFTIIFVDMDNLKDVNTRHGHAAGSRVLYEASVRITRSIRSIDRLFRYGGDEFVVLLPGTGLDGGQEVAERIRSELAQAPFEVASGAHVGLTASFGVAGCPGQGKTGRKIVEAADAAMREIKNRGKNGIAVAWETEAGLEPGDSSGSSRA
jgi:diguanylate cyclase (GGDEF)-like protein